MCYDYCFSTVKVVTLTRPSITLYLHCQSYGLMCTNILLLPYLLPYLRPYLLTYFLTYLFLTYLLPYLLTSFLTYFLT